MASGDHRERAGQLESLLRSAAWHEVVEQMRAMEGDTVAELLGPDLPDARRAWLAGYASAIGAAIRLPDVMRANNRELAGESLALEMEDHL